MNRPTGDRLSVCSRNDGTYLGSRVPELPVKEGQECCGVCCLCNLQQNFNELSNP